MLRQAQVLPPRRANRPWHPFGVPLRLALFFVSALLAYTLATPGGVTSVSAAQYHSIAMLAGVGGNITTLACYDPNPFVAHPNQPGKPNPWAPCRTTDDSPPDTVTGSHGGVNVPTDIGNSGSTVYAQVDYVPNAVRGGYIWTDDATSGCYGGNAGQRTRVVIYYYDATGLTDAHEVWFGHIVQSGGMSLSTWYRWNNAYATNPMWPNGVWQYKLNNIWNGGAPVGSVKTSPSGSCITGSHLHQEMSSGHSESYVTSNYSEGCWFVAGMPAQSPCTVPGYRWVAGESVTGRYTDIANLQIYVH